MHTRFFTQINDIFQMIIILQCQCDCNLIQLIFRQDIVDILNTANYLDPLVHSSARDPVVQNPSDNITPLGIGIDPRDIFLCCSGITDQQNIFQIVTTSSKKLQKIFDHHPADSRKYDVDPIKEEHHNT